jgi:hypothetical protein
MATESIAGTAAWLDGVEFVNDARTRAYIENGLGPAGLSVQCDTLCPDMLEVIGCGPEGGFVSPLADGAPWISTSYPESRDFLGLLVTDFEGLQSTLTREVHPVLNEGAILGRLRAGHRTLSWKAYLVGRTCCSVAYGLRWLTRQLSGPSACAGSCTTSTLDLITCCPEFPDDDSSVSGVVGGGYGGTIYGSPSYGGPDQTVMLTEPVFPVQESANDRAFRTLYNVGLIEGPLITEQVRVGCGCGCSEIMQVEFTLVAGKPYLYQNAITIVENHPLSFGVPTEYPELEDCTTFDCAVNPDCPPPATPPLPVLTDNCYVTPVLPTATRISVPRNYWPDMSDVVPIITIYSGTSPLVSTTLDFYESVSGEPCGELVGLTGLTCNPACGTLKIPYIPADSMFVIDGRINKMSVICPNRSSVQPGEKLTSGEWGWPVFSCYGFCFELITDQDILNASATVTFELVPRSL